MIRTQFDDNLLKLQHDIVTMGLRVEENLSKALLAVKNHDAELAELVKNGDAAINAMQIKIDDSAAILIATQQPVARDMRAIVALFKISDNLERIGDHVVHLAKAAKRLSKNPWPRSLDMLIQMASIDISMLHDAMQAYINNDIEQAKLVAARDDEIDTLNKAFIRDAIEFLMSEPDRASQAAKLIATSSFLERIGDHVTNICESIVFIISGEHRELN